MEKTQLNMLKQLADGIAAQFGEKCEVVIHDVNAMNRSIVYIVNGHVSGRKLGDGGSRVVIEQAIRSDAQPKDELCYLTRTPEGKILKSSSIYIRNSKGAVTGIFSINYDVTNLILMKREIESALATGDSKQMEPEKILNVNDLLDDLIEQSVELVGKPVPLMNKQDKIRAIQFLNQSGAFLVTKSGDKVAKYFGISKYTLYSYIDSKNNAGGVKND